MPVGNDATYRRVRFEPAKGKILIVCLLVAAVIGGMLLAILQVVKL
jgi:hypothetical protein